MVYMVLYGDGKAGYVMDEEGKSNLKKVFDEMNYIDSASSTVEKEVGDSIGEVWVTAYCPCSLCCGPYANGITASGRTARAKHTIAVDAYNPIVPMGTQVVIEGITYTVEDTGDLNHYGNDFDIFYAHHEDTSEWGRRHVEAYLAEGNTNRVMVTTSGTTVHNLTYKDYINKNATNEEQNKMLESTMDSDLWNSYYSSSAGLTVAELAMTKIGCHYSQDRRYEEGYYDCSSLVYRLYKEIGIELPATASEQGKYCYKNAMIISKKDLKPGDLIFYSYKDNGEFRNISHVAIYVGDGMMVHRVNDRDQADKYISAFYDEANDNAGDRNDDDTGSGNEEDIPLGAIGIIEIESLDIKYPIFEGAGDTELNAGIGHLPETADLLTEGNCVLAGHNGSRRGVFFTNLCEIQMGDMVVVTNKNMTTHTYKVVSTGTVGPNDASVRESKGREYLTLFTCANHGTMRFVVGCEPITDVQEGAAKMLNETSRDSAYGVSMQKE